MLDIFHLLTPIVFRTFSLFMVYFYFIRAVCKVYFLSAAGAVMPKNRPGPARPGRINFCHRWLKEIQTKIAALAMITQPRQTSASHMDFDSFTVLMRLFRS